MKTMGGSQAASQPQKVRGSSGTGQPRGLNLSSLALGSAGRRGSRTKEPQRAEPRGDLDVTYCSPSLSRGKQNSDTSVVSGQNLTLQG